MNGINEQGRRKRLMAEAEETLKEHDYMIALKSSRDSRGRKHCNSQTGTRKKADMFAPQ